MINQCAIISQVIYIHKIVSPFRRIVARSARYERGGCLSASYAHCVRLQAVTIVSPFGQIIRTMPDAALDVISIATGIDLRKTDKEDNTMKKMMSTFERVFREEGKVEGREEGRAEGIEKTIRNYIERKRSRHVSERQIHEELLLDFGLDAAKARQYMEPSLAKA